jgi:RNA polymerase sigma-70 factor (ECF subfamily)
MSKLSDPATWPDRYGDTLYRNALLRLRNKELAEDMVQEALLAAYASRDKFAGNSSEKTWLFSILKHKIIDYLRKASREQPLYQDVELFQDLMEESFDGRGHWTIDISQWSDPDKSLEQQAFWQILDKCIADLPPHLATLFMLRELDGLSSEDICKELNISTTNNLWVMLSRTRMRLRQCLDTNWFSREQEVN